MKLLHDIKGVHKMWLWAVAYGGRSRPLGHNPNRWWPFLHAYLIDRGTPPPMGEQWAARNRRYWTPYATQANGLSVEQILTPACGRIKTQSKMPHLSISRRNPWDTGQPNYCPTCLQLQPHTEFFNNIIELDPWRQILTTMRERTPDPVSGL